MYALPCDFDGKFLIGRTLEMICFGPYTIFIHFDKDVGITLGGEFSYQQEGGQPVHEALNSPIQQSNLMRLLQHTVAEVVLPGDDTLSLVFDNGDVLSCIDTPGYESYEVKNGENVIIV